MNLKTLENSLPCQSKLIALMRFTRAQLARLTGCSVSVGFGIGFVVGKSTALLLFVVPFWQYCWSKIDPTLNPAAMTSSDFAEL